MPRKTHKAQALYDARQVLRDTEAPAGVRSEALLTNYVARLAV